MPDNRSTIAIVGGAGYIGSALAHHFSGTYDVRVLDTRRPRAALSAAADYYECNVLDLEQVRRGLENVDVVIHTAIVQIPQINEQKKIGYQVNVTGTQNVCKTVDETPSIKGMILAGSWHVFGERDFNATINEEFGFRPDKVEDRARLYALSKISQEVITRFYDEFSTKVFGVIRMGTVLGEGMPDKTAANIFISRGLRGEAITPYRESMHRAMFYVDVHDVCLAFESYARKLLDGGVLKQTEGAAHIVNVFWREAITILELGYLTRDTIARLTEGRVNPRVEIQGIEQPVPPQVVDAEKQVTIDTRRIQGFLGITDLTDPRKTLERIIQSRLDERQQ